MNSRVRIGAVTYLNAKPLIYDLERIAPDAELVLDLPSRLADRLAAGDLDVALIPVIEYLRAGIYALVPDIAIATRGPALSVTLFSKLPWQQIRSVALDEGSRTSAALVQMIFRRRYDVNPRVEPLPIAADPEAMATDAVLLIGDRAMHACLAGHPHAYDLGEEWSEWTGLPFVFAVWAARREADHRAVQGIHRALLASRAWGLGHLNELADVAASTTGIDRDVCRAYLADLDYALSYRHLAGLTDFFRRLAQDGLVPDGSLSFITAA